MKTLFYLAVFIIFGVLILSLCRAHYIEADAEFSKLRPVNGKIYVYYNGFKLGHVKTILPCRNSSGTCVKMSLNRSKMFLPSNITVKMKQKENNRGKYQDYIEIVYPTSPSYMELKDGAVIKGVLASGFRNYMNEEVGYDEIERVKLSILKGSEDFQKAAGVLFELISNVNDITEKTAPDIVQSVKNLNRTTKNVGKISSDVSLSVNEAQIKSVINNLDAAMYNLNSAGYNVMNLSGTVNRNSSDISGTITSLNSISQDTAEIVRGINCTLRKPFGGLRLLFGKAIR